MSKPKKIPKPGEWWAEVRSMYTIYFHIAERQTPAPFNHPKLYIRQDAFISHGCATPSAHIKRGGLTRKASKQEIEAMHTLFPSLYLLSE